MQLLGHLPDFYCLTHRVSIVTTLMFKYYKCEPLIFPVVITVNMHVGSSYVSSDVLMH